MSGLGRGRGWHGGGGGRWRGPAIINYPYPSFYAEPIYLVEDGIPNVEELPLPDDEDTDSSSLDGLGADPVTSSKLIPLALVGIALYFLLKKK